MSKSQSGYEITLRLWVPVDHTDRKKVATASAVVDALESLKFEDVLAADGAIIEKIECKVRYVSKRADKE